MKFFFYTSISFEKWNYNNSIKQGIGGSETSIVEMSWRLARDGHDVTVYAPIPKRTQSPWRGVKWLHHDRATFKQKGIWIIYRVPEAIDKFLPRRKDQQLWFMWQDWDYPNLTKKRTYAVDRHITLCHSHARYMISRYPHVGERLWISSNGIKRDLLEEIEKEGIKRDPLRLINASSPDRGMKQAILIYRKAREYVPGLSLHLFYGFNNLDKIVKANPKSNLATEVAKLKELIATTPGVVFHGRVSQPDLYREWFKSGIYVYITSFFETSNIASQEAQACGAIPMFSPIYAQKENIRHGVGIEGPMEPLTIARATSEVVRLASIQGLQETIRLPMMEWARNRFDWDNFIIQWTKEALGERREFEKEYDFPTQL